MAAATKATADVGLVQPVRRRRKFIDENATPAGALVWRTVRQKSKLFDEWRVAVGKSFPKSARDLRLAWTLEWLFGEMGFAYATDGYLSRKLGIPANKIQASLCELESGGAIIRASVVVRGEAQRRIWPSSEIIKRSPPVTGGGDTPRHRSEHTPSAGGTEYLLTPRRSKSVRLSSTAEAARRDAELRNRKRAAECHDDQSCEEDMHDRK
jgi:hypothetical protein